MAQRPDEDQWQVLSLSTLCWDWCYDSVILWNGEQGLLITLSILVEEDQHVGQRLLECQGDGQKQVIRICIFSFVVPRRSCLSWSHKTMLVFFFWCYRVHWQLIIPMMSWPALGWQKKHRVWQWTLHLGCWCLKDSLRWEQAAEFMRYSHRSVLLSIQFSAGITVRAHTSDACQSFQSMLQWCILLIPHPPFPSTQIQLLLVPAVTPWLSFAQVTMLISRDNLIAYSLGNCK